MAVLGTPYRIFYQAPQFRSGLTDVMARVLRPDLTIMTTIALSEVPVAGFNGLYSAQIQTIKGDPAGEYIVRVICASQGVMDDRRISFDIDPLPPILSGINGINLAIGQGAALSDIVGEIEEVGELEGELDGPGLELVGEIFDDEELEGDVQ